VPASSLRMGRAIKASVKKPDPRTCITDADQPCPGTEACSRECPYRGWDRRICSQILSRRQALLPAASNGVSAPKFMMKAILFLIGDEREIKPGERAVVPHIDFKDNEICHSQKGRVLEPVLASHEWPVPKEAISLRVYYSETDKAPHVELPLMQDIPLPRPKVRVKKWRWVAEDPSTHYLFVTDGRFHDQADFDRWGFYANDYALLIPILQTEIEVEE